MALALALALAACAEQGHRVTLPRAGLGTERARLRGVLATESGAHGEWMYAGDWTDELTLAAVGDRLCVLLALRDPVTGDLDDLGFELALDGAPAPMTVDTFAVEPIAEVTEGDRLTTGGHAIRGQVCTPARPATRVDLRVIHHRLSFRGGGKPGPRYYQARYRWDLTD